MSGVDMSASERRFRSLRTAFRCMVIEGFICYSMPANVEALKLLAPNDLLDFCPLGEKVQMPRRVDLARLFRKYGADRHPRAFFLQAIAMSAALTSCRPGDDLSYARILFKQAFGIDMEVR